MKKVKIIAEAGVNHNGDINIAKRLVDEAVNAGADYIKFQSFKAENLVSRYAEKAEYQKKTTAENESQYEMIKRLELSREEHYELFNYCKQKGIEFISSPFDLESIDLLYELGISFYKIPSGEIINYPYLKRIAEKKLPVVMSSGMATMQEIKDALDVLTSNGLKLDDITVLHANTEYPTPFEDVNLLAMLSIKEEFGVKVGYSDHTPGIEVPVAAAALGAEVIEKHFTLNKEMEGPDHKASLEPYELAAMVKAIRNIEKALGDGIKKPSKSEQKNIPIARKSIVARTFIKKGEVFTEDNITAKRPGTGISPMKWKEVLGKTAKKDFYPDDLIEL